MNRVVSIMLSLLLLASHSTLTLGTHYCRGQAVDIQISIGKSDPGCCMAEMEEAGDTDGEKDFVISNPICCEDQYQELQATDDFIRDATHAIPEAADEVALADPGGNDVLSDNEAVRAYTDYLPPPMKKDIHSLFQFFLI